MKRFEKIKDFIFKYLEDNLDQEKYCYHCIEHTHNVIRDVDIFSDLPEISPQQKEILLVAALFHDIGYVNGSQNHEQRGAILARKELGNFNYSTSEIEEIAKLILATNFSLTPQDLLESIIKDADIGYAGLDNFDVQAQRLRNELLNNGITFTEKEWVKFELDFLNKFSFNSPIAKKLRAENKEKYRQHYLKLWENM